MNNKVAKPPTFETVSFFTTEVVYFRFIFFINFDTQDFNSLGYSLCLPLIEDFFIQPKYSNHF